MSHGRGIAELLQGSAIAVDASTHDPSPRPASTGHYEITRSDLISISAEAGVPLQTNTQAPPASDTASEIRLSWPWWAAHGWMKLVVAAR